jgi:hypothetical protein
MNGSSFDSKPETDHYLRRAKKLLLGAELCTLNTQHRPLMADDDFDAKYDLGIASYSFFRVVAALLEAFMRAPRALIDKEAQRSSIVMARLDEAEAVIKIHDGITSHGVFWSTEDF